MAEKICAAVCGVLALVALIISVMSFKEKGFLFNNAYVWATKEERKTMNKKPYYRQSAVAFAMVTVMFLCMTLEFLMQTGWMWVGVGLVCFVLLVYAIRAAMSST